MIVLITAPLLAGPLKANIAVGIQWAGCGDFVGFITTGLIQ